MPDGGVVNIERGLVVIGCDPSPQNWGLARAIVRLSNLSTLAEPVLEIAALRLVRTAPAGGKKVVRKSSDDLQRAGVILAEFRSFCAGAALCMVEVPSGCQSARGAMSNGICVGILSNAVLPLIQVDPSEVKLATVGSKTASKADMIAWATALYPDADWLRDRSGSLIAANEHLADAVASIHAGMKTAEFRAAASMMAMAS
ncbi:hypothetical protein [Azospirillum brasilense]|uniref:hypothetical protein n=1 Tax=Azospirillum brasilense TaxID=192 RepID=UPI000E681FDC|nr:hypothetical protein [Azospirillum brasilense]NUB23353.1 hypothetical protein [Azospirillum brasilense]NUB30975.1 hypothetical protein [Azospirillum brasilense]RIW05644.1 hypothetical protein D2T81_07305 [Azospirillum brasilense]